MLQNAVCDSTHKWCSVLFCAMDSAGPYLSSISMVFRVSFSIGFAVDGQTLKSNKENVMINRITRDKGQESLFK